MANLTAFLKKRLPGVIALLLPVCALAAGPSSSLDDELSSVLRRAGFTGTVGASIEQRLGRPIDPTLADLGRLLWFDTAGGLHDDNTCGGCHSPANGFGDSQSIAIGVQNNNVVGPHRDGSAQPAPHADRGQRGLLSQA